MGKQDYLFRRKGSDIWQFRLKTPAMDGEPARIRDVSTRTKSYEAALDIALPMIVWHRQIIARRRALRDAPGGGWVDGSPIPWNQQVELSAKHGVIISTGKLLKAGEKKPRKGGGWTQCSKDGSTLVHYDDADEIVGTEANPSGGTRYEYLGEDRDHKAIRKLEAKIRERNPQIEQSLDERAIQAWIKADGVSHERQLVARNAHKSLRAVAPHKTFASFSPADVRAMVAAWEAEGASTETQKHRKSHLSSIVACVTDSARKDLFPEITSNVFLGDYITPGIPGKRAQPRLFTEQDNALIMAELPSWPISLQRMYVLGKTMGLRREECFLIGEQEVIDGIICWRIAGTKTDGSDRMMPVAERFLPWMPSRPVMCAKDLFENSMWHTTAKLIEAIRAILDKHHIDHTGKTFHSFRHGLKTFLGQEEGVKESVIDTITGHVPDNLKGNEGKNQLIRQYKSLQWRYFRGHKAATIKAALDLMPL